MTIKEVKYPKSWFAVKIDLKGVSSDSGILEVTDKLGNVLHRLITNSEDLISKEGIFGCLDLILDQE